MFQKNIHRVLWILFAVLGMGAFIKACCIPTSVKILPSAEVTLLNHKWEIQETKLGILEYRYQIPKGNTGILRLYMRTYMPEFKVFLGEEEIYSFSDMNRSNGRSQHLIKLPNNVQGRELILRAKKTRLYSEKAKDFGTCYLGEENVVFIKIFRDNIYALFFALFALLLGLMNLFLAYFLRKKMSGNMLKAMLDLSVFIFIAGLWVLTDSTLLLFWSDRIARINFLSFLSFMIMPIFLLRFVYHLMGRWKILKPLCGLFLVNAILYSMNYLAEAAPGYILLLPTHILCVCSIVVVLKYGFEALKSSNKENKIRLLVYGFGFLAVFVLAALIVYYMNPVSPYPYLYCSGIFLFIICLIGSACSELYEQMEENANSAAYRRLAYTDSMTGLENRTAFGTEQKKTNLPLGRTYILFDINNLKTINDQFGHQIGDLIIIAAAKCIKEVFGTKGKCYRIGGDEFVVILNKSTVMETKEALADLQEYIKRENRKRRIPIDMAAGYAVLSKEGETSEQLYRKADVNMYMEKQKMKSAGK